MKITNEVIESYLNCKYKAYLKLKGTSGKKTDYEIMQLELRREHKKKVIKKITASSNKDEVLKKLGSVEELRKGPKFVLNPLLDYEGRRINFDVLERVEGTSQLGDFHYIPIHIKESNKIDKDSKKMITFLCIVLGEIQGKQPEFGKIVYGDQLKTSKIRTETNLKEARKIMQEVTKIKEDNIEPRLMLNRHCQVCEFKDSCRAKAVEKDDLSLLGGISEKEIVKHNNRGIFSVHQLSYTFRPRKPRKLPGKPQRYLYELKALALREKQTYIQGAPQFSAVKTEVYLDFEGIPDGDFIYLIGIIIGQGDIYKQISLWANSKEEECQIFQQFFDILSKFNEFVIYHYGNYEVKYLKKFSKKFGSEFEGKVNSIIKNSNNILSYLTTDIYPPTYTNELKDIGNSLGFEWSDPKASGLQSLVWRKKWELSKASNIKKKLIQYNIEDCIALKIIKNWLESIRESNEKIINIGNMKIRKNSDYNFQVMDYQTSDFKTINKCAYFDYQRNKIYLRTNKKIKKALKVKEKQSGLVNKPDKVEDIIPQKCPQCSNKRLIKVRENKRIRIDLKFMKNGVKKWAVEYNSGSFQCCKCKHTFTPKDFRWMPRYGHNLMVWSMNQYIQYRVSIEQVIEMLLDLYNIEVSMFEMFHFKRKLADKYKVTYEEIKQCVIKGDLIHADETGAKVRKLSSGYVWVFTNMDSVFYLFKPTREADFLEELLKGFNGVLISDFYSGYDSLPCSQQKCLVHLLRDLNEDLLKNQFNEEYKTIVIAFGKLLRTIIETIDKYGLKKRHLHKHKRDVDSFFRRVIEKEYETEISIKYQKRFRKNRDTLFTFLDFDNVPWNNNNAEHAVKSFAKYRRKMNKSYTERSIKEYLVLLSIQQTCKYRGISFLEFLKSGELSIEEFSKNF